MGVRENIRAYMKDVDPRIRSILFKVLDEELTQQDLDRPRMSQEVRRIIDQALEAKDQA